MSVNRLLASKGLMHWSCSWTLKIICIVNGFWFNSKTLENLVLIHDVLQWKNKKIFAISLFYYPFCFLWYYFKRNFKNTVSALFLVHLYVCNYAWWIARWQFEGKDNDLLLFWMDMFQPDRGRAPMTLTILTSFTTSATEYTARSAGCLPTRQYRCTQPWLRSIKYLYTIRHSDGISK